MLILNVLYEFPESRDPENPRAEVHEFTVEFGYDPARGAHFAYYADTVHDTRIVSFSDADAARVWLLKKNFTRLRGYVPPLAAESPTPDPGECATECWVFQPEE